MAAIIFTCPHTGKSLDTGIQSDEDPMEMDAATLEPISLHCPFCDEIHTFLFKDARFKEYRLGKAHKATLVTTETLEDLLKQSTDAEVILAKELAREDGIAWEASATAAESKTDQPRTATDDEKKHYLQTARSDLKL